VVRTTAGGNSQNGLFASNPNFPGCYKIVRQGGNVTAYASTSPAQGFPANPWYQGSSPVPLSLNPTAAVGVYVGPPGFGTQLATATFNNITISQTPEFVISGPTFTTQFSLNGIPATYDFQILPILNFSAPVTMSASGLPAGVTASFSPSTISGGGGTVLTLTADSTAVQGQYSVTVTAAGGGITQTTTVVLKVGGGVNAAFAPGATVTGGTAGGAFFAQIPVTLTSVGGAGLSTPSFTIQWELQGDSGLALAGGLTTPPTSPPVQLSATAPTITYVPMVIPAGTSFGGVAANLSLLLLFQGSPGALDYGGFHPLLFAPSLSFTCADSSPQVSGGSTYSVVCTNNWLGGTTGPVTIGATLPTGVTFTSATPNPIPYNAVNATSTINLAASQTTPGGIYPFAITATNGTVSQSWNSQIKVNNFGWSATPASQTVQPGGSTTYTVTDSPWTSVGTSVTLSVSGLPAHATASFNPSSISTPNDTPATATLTVNTATNTPPGTYTLTLTAVDSSFGVTRTTNVTLIVTGTFSITTSAGTTTITAGSNGTNTVTVTATGGFSDTVNLSVSGLPTGATGTFNPTSVNGSGNSTLTISTTAATVGGTYTVTITGTSNGASGNQVKTKTFSLVIRSFTLSASSTTLNATHGGAAVTDTITLTLTGGFNSTVTFSVTGLPSGTTGSFNPTSRNTNGTSTMTITAGSSTAPGTYSLTVKGTSGTLVQSTPVTLIVH
jgi:uncharacterized membrane protein